MNCLYLQHYRWTQIFPCAVLGDSEPHYYTQMHCLRHCYQGNAAKECWVRIPILPSHSCLNVTHQAEYTSPINNNTRPYTIRECHQ